MAFSRYTKTSILRMGEQYGTAFGVTIVRTAIKNGTLTTSEFIVHEAQRLDTIAGSIYGDGRYWWVLAATSNIGWGLQIAPGTLLNVADLADVAELIG